MDRLFNPFRYIAGTKSLVWGLIFIISEIVLLYGNGYVMDGYVHITQKPDGMLLWQAALVHVVMWLLPALLLYCCGLVMSHSKIRVVDILGTTAFAQLLLLPIIVPMLIPAVADMLKTVADAALDPAFVSIIDTLPVVPLLLFAVWSLVWLILFYVWNYNAFSTSCNVRGAKAITVYIVVSLVVAIVAPHIFALLC